MIVLVGDLGGTHTRLARARLDARTVTLERVVRYRNARHAGFDDMLRDFMADARDWEACCLAVAGPTDGWRVTFTNLDWHLDTEDLAMRHGLPRVHLINDFAAVGWGLDTLAPRDLLPLQQGIAEVGAPRLAVGAGTGLGVSLCLSCAGRYRPSPSEGGHIGFSPVTPEQERLHAYLRRMLGGRVSIERVVSGPGIVALYRFLCAEAGQPEHPLPPGDDAAAAIAAAGLQGGDARALAALRLFARLYGQAAGDLALVARAQGGVYLAGGIAPRLLSVLRDGEFLAGFHDKGRFAEWMRSVPVQVVLDADIALKGAAYAAALPSD